MKRTLATAFLCLLLVTPAWAGMAEATAAYERGDYATSLREIRPLAGQGRADAQFKLGYLYKKGQGVPRDYAEAVRWYRKAAEQGYALAQSNLGVMYARGNGVPQDYVQARKWFNLAAIQGHKKAQKNRDIAAKNMTPADVSKAQKLAHEWWVAFKKRKRK